MKLYHGTARALGMLIEKEGIDPEGPFKDMPFRSRLAHDGKSSYSIPSYVYFFEDKKMAAWFGCESAKKVGLLPDKAQVFEIDSGQVKVEPDPKLPRSWMHKGTILPDKFVSKDIIDCNELIMEPFFDKRRSKKAEYRELKKLKGVV